MKDEAQVDTLLGVLLILDVITVDEFRECVTITEDRRIYYENNEDISNWTAFNG